MAKFFHIWSSVAGYGELCECFYQSESGKYFERIIKAFIAWTQTSNPVIVGWVNTSSDVVLVLNAQKGK